MRSELQNLLYRQLCCMPFRDLSDHSNVAMHKVPLLLPCASHFFASPSPLPRGKTDEHWRKLVFNQSFQHLMLFSIGSWHPETPTDLPFAEQIRLKTWHNARLSSEKPTSAQQQNSASVTPAATKSPLTDWLKERTNILLHTVTPEGMWSNNTVLYLSLLVDINATALMSVTKLGRAGMRN